MRVTTEPDHDRDDNPILRIVVFIDETERPLDVQSMLDLPGILRAQGQDDAGFPIISYISMNEMSARHAAQ